MLWILWNGDFDFVVQAIDSWLFAIAIRLITITVALSRHSTCQNRDFFFLILYYNCIQTWQAFSTVHLDVKAAVSLISMPNSLNSCPYAFFFYLLFRTQSTAQLSTLPLGGNFISRGGKEDSNHCSPPGVLRIFPSSWAPGDIWQLEKQCWCLGVDSIVCIKICRVQEKAFPDFWDSINPCGTQLPLAKYSSLKLSSRGAVTAEFSAEVNSRICGVAGTGWTPADREGLFNPKPFSMEHLWICDSHRGNLYYIPVVSFILLIFNQKERYKNKKLCKWTLIHCVIQFNDLLIFINTFKN